MKKNIVEVYNEKSQRKKWTKRRMLNLAVSSGLLLTSLVIPVIPALTTGTITASAAVLDVEILSNITTNNNSGTTTSNRWASDKQNQPVNFTISGGELVGATAVTSGKKQAVLAIPAELRGKVAPAGDATISTNITLDLSKVTLLTSVLDAVNDLTNVITQITSGVLGDLTGVDINLNEVNRQLDLINNIEHLGGASFSSTPTLAADGSYISANVNDGLGLVVAQNLSTILQDLNSAVSGLEASGSGLSAVVATAINAALLPVKGTVNTAVTAALPLLQAGGSAISQIADASVLGATTVTLPTTVSAPQNLTGNLDAKFVGSVIQSDAIDVNVISTGNGSTTIYFAPSDTTVGVTAPTVNSVTGTSTAGYTVTGTADPNVNIEIRNQGGTVVGRATADASGAFTVTIASGSASANEDLNAVAINGDNESTATGFKTPADPSATVATPVVNHVTGNTTKGYEVSGTAEAGTTIEVRSTDGTVLGTGTTDAEGNYTVTLAPGKASASEDLEVVAINAAGTESQPATATTPADVAAPSVDKVTGSTTNGYEVTGKAGANQTVEIQDIDGNVIGTGTANAAGDYTVTIDPGKAEAGDTIHVIAKDSNGNESQPTTAKTPADVTAPTVDEITGNTTDGYEVDGKADPNTTVEVRDPDGTVIGSDTSDANGDYTVVIDPGKVTPGDTITVISKDDDGNESQPTEVEVPADPSAVTAPTVKSVTGTSTDGYTVTGTADPNVNIEIRNQSGTVVGTATADASGAFTVNIQSGSASAEENLKAVAIKDNKESTATGFKTPADPVATVATPEVDKVTGNTTKGYEITGTAEANTTIEVRSEDDTVVGTGTTDAEGNYTVTLAPGKASASEDLEVVAINTAGAESQPATATTPADVTAPTVDEITGNPTDGYEVNGKADPNTTIEVRDPNGDVIGTDTSDANGDYTVTIDPGKANPGDTITVIGKDTAGNESQPTTAIVPAEEGDIIIAQPTIVSVTGTSTDGYVIKGKAEPNRIIQISNTRLKNLFKAEDTVKRRSLFAAITPLAAANELATTTTDASGNFTVELAAGQAEAEESLLATATDGQGNYSLATLFSTPADPTSPTDPTDPTTPTDPDGNTNGGTGSDNGGTNSGDGTGIITPGTGDPNGRGTGSASTGTNGALGSGVLNGFGRGNAGSRISTSKYPCVGSTSTSKGAYPRTGEKQTFMAGIVGGLLALLASVGLVKSKRKED